MNNMKFSFLIPFLLIISQLFGQTNNINRSISWENSSITIEPISKNFIISFDNANYPDNETMLPYYFDRISLKNNENKIIKCEVINIVYETFEIPNIEKIQYKDKITENLSLNYKIEYERKKPYLNYSFIPLRKNPFSNKIERVKSFTLSYIIEQTTDNQNKSLKYATNSVLKSGNWVKVEVTADGVYKVTYDELIDMGFSNPTQGVRVFGNGGGMLPTSNTDFNYDDLQENAIYIDKGSDAVFNKGDYILFYGQGPTKWTYNNIDNMFEHDLHKFSNATYYFITEGNPKLITTENSSTNTPNYTLTTFDDYLFHELEENNLIKSGSQWFGEHFDIDLNYSFDFNFPNIKTSDPIKIRTQVAARSAYNSTFKVLKGSSLIQEIIVSSVVVSNTTGDYAKTNIDISQFSSSSSSIPLNVGYIKPSNYQDAEGWLDFIELNAKRNLTGNNLIFRDISSVGSGNITEFQISNSSPNTIIWDITDPINVKQIISDYSGTTTNFRVSTDSLREFASFDGTNFLSPTFVNIVSNQNLHGLSQKDMIIVSHPDFLADATQLASIHASHDNLNVAVVTPQQVYNEFSSGSPDISAIRNFMRMFYDRATTEDEMPKYLLLFGDGSYDNIHYTASNSNYILTYQSEQSLKPTGSFVTDDFYALLDANESVYSGSLDFGVGRLPVRTTEEAQNFINKVNNYYNPSSMGDWRNFICFIGDDEDGNQHMSQADQLAKKVETNHPVFNIQKIYLDSYVQETTPAGETYPEVNRLIADRMNRGALIMNYTGHGNEIGLAHEAILSINDINSWTNIDKMPVFITATCEFGRWDDYERTSAGEMIFLNPQGGGIALLTTTRLVYSTPNFNLNNAFYDSVFVVNPDHEYYRLGDIMRFTKNNAGSGTNKRNFSLLGDPALQLAIPEHNVITLKINNIDISTVPDTLKALSKVTITGQVENNQGQKLSTYDGILYPTVFDKSDSIVTLSNDGLSPFKYTVQNSILYKGKASISDGEFTFSFIVPKDISYRLGFGKISYYADNKSINTSNYSDANGYHNNIIIGGSADNIVADNKGPEIKLFMNDTGFVYGGITDENPLMIAKVFDENGINTVGNGIGHDIVATIDETTNAPYILNDYYESDIDSYQKGSIDYNFFDLDEGIHKLNLKVWDVYNNSSEEYIEFIVAKSEELLLDHVFNYPNPFTTNTAFYFDHNQPNVDLDVLLQVFTITGKLVKTLQTTINTNGYRSEPIYWDGLDDYGDKIGRGVYIYRLKVRSENGNIVDKFEKLVILK